MKQRDDNPSAEDAFVAEVKRAFDEMPLEADLATRLAAARRRAVERAENPSPWVPPRWVPVGALAATILAIGAAMRLADEHGLPVFEDEVQFVVAQERELLEELEFLAFTIELDHAG